MPKLRRKVPAPPRRDARRRVDRECFEEVKMLGTIDPNLRNPNMGKLLRIA
ncbi:MAG TPA: hypothetical protein VMV69_03900 [Pirellulales bacterium]|nr:hypothetical protein [Pirellulales bacterium]